MPNFKTKLYRYTFRNKTIYVINYITFCKLKYVSVINGLKDKHLYVYFELRGLC